MAIQMISHRLAKKILGIFLKRSNQSHKGEHGRLVVIGGCTDYYGAPALAMKGALNSGTDLVYGLVPDPIAESVRAFTGADYITRSYPGNHLTAKGLPLILKHLEIADALVIGPGIGRKAATFESIRKILDVCTVPVVVDADALHGINLKKKRKYPLIITPHRREFKDIFGVAVPPSLAKASVYVSKAAIAHNVFIVLKGATDIIASPNGKIFVNGTGNPGMTGSGTGDVFAGVLGGLLAQNLDVLSACNCAAYLSGSAGDHMQKTHGYAFSATQVADSVPLILKKVM